MSPTSLGVGCEVAPAPYQGELVAAIGEPPEAVVFFDRDTGDYAYLGPEGWAFWHYRAPSPTEALSAVRQMLAHPQAWTDQGALERLKLRALPLAS